jgi:hypothetical protein
VRWFKCFSEIRTDPKVRTMPEAMRWRLVALYSLCCDVDPADLTENEIGCALDLNARQLSATKALFLSKHFIEPDWSVPKFLARQAPADPTAAQRQRRHRDRHAQRNGDVTITSPRAPAPGGEENRVEEKRIEERGGASPRPPVTSRCDEEPEALPAEAVDVARLAADLGGSPEWSAWALRLYTEGCPAPWIREALATARRKGKLTQSYIEGILTTFAERGGSDRERGAVRGAPPAPARPAATAIEEPAFIPDTAAGAAIRAMYKKGRKGG